MSNALAIAAVSAVLKALLEDGLTEHEATSGMDVTVSVLPPDRVLETFEPEDNQINLFLYQVTPNPGWRNVGLPSRDGRGERVSNPPLALDLHYMLTVYSYQNFNAERLLGYAMQRLHETPGLSRATIRATLQAPNELSDTDLADQVEQIKITPKPLTSEELSNIWSNLQSRYRPTVAYEVSVVLIESRRAVRSALPVRLHNIYARTFRQPQIERVGSQATASTPISFEQPILPGYRLVLNGRQLRGDDTLVRIGVLELPVALSSVGDTRIVVPLPAGLQAGVQGAQVLHRVLIGTPPVPHRGVESNVAAFVLRPTFDEPPAFVPAAGDDPQALALAFDPPVGKQQRVVLLLNELQAAPPPDPPLARAYSFTLAPRAGDATDSDTELSVPIPAVAAGTYLVRVQVDGAESLLEAAADGRFTGPTVVIP